MSEKRKLQLDRGFAYAKMDNIIKLLIINMSIIISIGLFSHYFFDLDYIYIIISFALSILLNIKNFKRVYYLNKEISEIDNKIQNNV